MSNQRPDDAAEMFGMSGAERVVVRLDSYSQEQHLAGINAARERRLSKVEAHAERARRARLAGVSKRHLTTELAIEAVEYERAPRYPGRTVNRRIVCADGFAVSVQASPSHYANDSSDEAPYWKTPESPDQMAGVAYPFTTFEVGNPTAPLEPAEAWARYDNDGTWAWVPPQLVAELLDAHGGAVAWEQSE